MSEKKTNAMRLLDKSNIGYETIHYEYSNEHLDAITVSKSISHDIKYVYKTLVLIGNDKNHYVCIIQGDDELDLKKTAKALSLKSISMINLSEINKVTGYIKGGCSPIGMKKLYKSIISNKAENLEYIIVSAGQRGMQIKLSVSDLSNIINSKFEDITKDR